jgi:L-lactate utilization protein LutB
MNLQELKDKFRHKTKADLSDIDLALQAAPFLVRKVESLEAELLSYQKRIAHLEQQANKKRPNSYKGSKNGTEWMAELDDKKNLLLLVFSGNINHRTAKLSSNSIHPIFSNMRKDCRVIIDVSKLVGFNNRVMFHFRKILYTLDVMGAEKVIYILPPGDDDLVHTFKKASENLGYQIFIASSLEKAEEIIDKSAHFLKA